MSWAAAKRGGCCDEEALHHVKAGMPYVVPYTAKRVSSTEENEEEEEEEEKEEEEEEDEEEEEGGEEEARRRVRKPSQVLPSRREEATATRSWCV